jgi:hypothetical protein
MPGGSVEQYVMSLDDVLLRKVERTHKRTHTHTHMSLDDVLLRKVPGGPGERERAASHARRALASPCCLAASHAPGSRPSLAPSHARRGYAALAPLLALPRCLPVSLRDTRAGFARLRGGALRARVLRRLPCPGRARSLVCVC